MRSHQSPIEPEPVLPEVQFDAAPSPEAPLIAPCGFPVEAVRLSPDQYVMVCGPECGDHQWPIPQQRRAETSSQPALVAALRTRAPQRGHPHPDTEQEKPHARSTRTC